MNSPDKYTRRDALFAIARGIAILPMIPKNAFADVLSPSVAFRESKNAQGENTDLFPNSFKRYIIDYNGSPVASFFTVEQQSSHASLSFIPNNPAAPLSPENLTKSDSTVFAFAGPFTNKQGKTAGKAYFQGKNAGENDWQNSFSGVLLIDEKGLPQIINIAEAQKTAFLQRVEKNKLSFFQQYPLIHQGMQTDISQKLIQSSKKWRFFVKRTDGTHGVLDFSDTNISLNQAIHIAIESGVEEALFLDMGASSLGYYKAKDGTFPFYDTQFKDVLSLNSPGGYIVGKIK